MKAASRSNKPHEGWYAVAVVMVVVRRRRRAMMTALLRFAEPVSMGEE